MSDFQIQATLTRPDKTGGHSPTLTTALYTSADTTLDELLSQGLAYRQGGELVVEDEDYITIRVAKKPS